MNSEIIGKPTHSDYGVVFAKDMRQYLPNYGGSPVDDVSFEHTDTFGPSEDGYVPMVINLTFKNQPEINNEIGIKNYVEVNMYNFLTVPRFAFLQQQMAPVPENIAAPTYSQLQDGTYTGKVPVYGISRYPAQLYESFTCILLFILLFLIWNHYKVELPEGLLLGLFLVILFGLRFMHELFKENQVAFEDDLALNMGQILSIPLIIAGIFIFVRALMRGRVKS